MNSFGAVGRIAGAGLAWLCAGGVARADWVEHVAVGVGHTAHDLLPTDASPPEQGAMATVELQFQPIEQLSLLGKPRPYVGVATSLEGFTNFLQAGVSWRHSVSRSYYLDIGVGGAVHDGELTLPKPESGQSEEENARRRRARDERTEFTNRGIYHAKLSVGRRFTERWSGELSYQHWSNGRLGASTNDGSDLLEFRVAFRP